MKFGPFIIKAPQPPKPERIITIPESEVGSTEDGVHFHIETDWARSATPADFLSAGFVHESELKELTDKVQELKVEHTNLFMIVNRIKSILDVSDTDNLIPLIENMKKELFILETQGQLELKYETEI